MNTPIVRCQECGKRNRISTHSAAEKPICGNCGTPLTQHVDDTDKSGYPIMAPTSSVLHAGEGQGNLFQAQSDAEDDVSRSLLDQMLADSRLYKDSDSYKELLTFVARLRNVAPFNAMLLQLQKPGITHVASAYDWHTLFNRQPKDGARPLLILWPFGPVATVYDLQDTDGDELPEDAFAFPASGRMTTDKIASFVKMLQRKNIKCTWVDTGDASAGAIRVVEHGAGKSKPTVYQIKINRNQKPPVQFTTLAHELGHLFLGHLGADKKLHVPSHRRMDLANVEIEAESVAFLVCARNGVASKSQKYLSHFIKRKFDVQDIDIYQITRAAGQVETILQLISHTKFK